MVNESLEELIIPLNITNCMCIGYLIKNSLDFVDNKYIPLIVAIVGTIFNIWLNNWEVTPKTIVSGLVTGLSSTGAFELGKNILCN